MLVCERRKSTLLLTNHIVCTCVHTATQPHCTRQCNQPDNGAATSQNTDYCNQPDKQAELLHELEELWDSESSGRSTPQEQNESGPQDLDDERSDMTSTQEGVPIILEANDSGPRDPDERSDMTSMQEGVPIILEANDSGPRDLADQHPTRRSHS